MPGGGTVPLASLGGVASVLEFVGGWLLLVGLFTRPAAFVLSGEMAFAYFIGHAPNGFWPVLNGGGPAIYYCFTFLYPVRGGRGSVEPGRADRGEIARAQGLETSRHPEERSDRRRSRTRGTPTVSLPFPGSLASLGMTGWKARDAFAFRMTGRKSKIGETNLSIRRFPARRDSERRRNDESHGAGQGDEGIRGGSSTRQQADLRNDGLQRAARESGRDARGRGPEGELRGKARPVLGSASHGHRRPLRGDQGAPRRLLALAGALDGRGDRMGQALPESAQRGVRARDPSGLRVGRLHGRLRGHQGKRGASFARRVSKRARRSEITPALRSEFPTVRRPGAEASGRRSFRRTPGTPGSGPRQRSASTSGTEAHRSAASPAA